MSREFQLAIDEAEKKLEPEEEWPETITLVDPNTGRREEIYYHNPSETQIALYSAAFSRDSGGADMMYDTRRMFRAIMEPDSYQRFMNILWDERADDETMTQKIEVLRDIIRMLFEEVTGRPTLPSSGSTSSRRPGGRQLTDRLPPKGSTRSRSPRAASATSSTRTSSTE